MHVEEMDNENSFWNEFVKFVKSKGRKWFWFELKNKRLYIYKKKGKDHAHDEIDINKITAIDQDNEETTVFCIKTQINCFILQAETELEC